MAERSARLPSPAGSARSSSPTCRRSPKPCRRRALATYNGFFVPKQTPQEVVDAIAKEVAAAVKTREFSGKLIEVGFEPFGSTPEEMVAMIAADRQNWLAIKGDLVAATQ